MTPTFRQDLNVYLYYTMCCFKYVHRMLIYTSPSLIISDVVLVLKKENWCSSTSFYPFSVYYENFTHFFKLVIRNPLILVNSKTHLTVLRVDLVILGLRDTDEDKRTKTVWKGTGECLTRYIGVVWVTVLSKLKPFRITNEIII